MRTRDFVSDQCTLSGATPFSHKLFGCGGAAPRKQAFQERLDVAGVDGAVAIHVAGAAVVGRPQLL